MIYKNYNVNGAKEAMIRVITKNWRNSFLAIWVWEKKKLSNAHPIFCFFFLLATQEPVVGEWEYSVDSWRPNELRRLQMAIVRQCKILVLMTRSLFPHSESADCLLFSKLSIDPRDHLEVADWVTVTGSNPDFVHRSRATECVQSFSDYSNALCLL